MLPDPASPAPAAGRILSVLILEDQALVRAGMRGLISASRPGAHIHEAGTYEDAVQALAGGEISVAFLDIELRSERTGLDVLRYMRSEAIPCRAIMLSAIAEEATVMECLRLGASGYIQKDMNPAGLFRDAVDSVLQGRIFLPESVLGRGSRPENGSAPGKEENNFGLHGRALEALYHICQGHSNKVVAHKMGVSESTVANDYKPRLFKHFKVSSSPKLIIEVARTGLAIPVPRPAPAR